MKIISELHKRVFELPIHSLDSVSSDFLLFLDFKRIVRWKKNLATRKRYSLSESNFKLKEKYRIIKMVSKNLKITIIDESLSMTTMLNKKIEVCKIFFSLNDTMFCISHSFTV